MHAIDSGHFVISSEAEATRADASAGNGRWFIISAACDHYVAASQPVFFFFVLLFFCRNLLSSPRHEVSSKLRGAFLHMRLLRICMNAHRTALLARTSTRIGLNSHAIRHVDTPKRDRELLMRGYNDRSLIEVYRISDPAVFARATLRRGVLKITEARGFTGFSRKKRLVTTSRLADRTSALARSLSTWRFNTR